MLEEQSYRYQIALSDLAGIDIKAHEGEYAKAIGKVRYWIPIPGESQQIGPSKVLGEYEDFPALHFEELKKTGFSPEDIEDYPTGELIVAMTKWASLGCPRS